MLTPSDPTWWFGNCVSISGDTAVVSACRSNVGSNQEQGAVYVYVKPSGGWRNMTQTAKLLSSDGAFHDWFGRSVAISGTVSLVGAQRDDDNGNLAGSAYLFAAAACPADLDGSGAVDFEDILRVLDAWGDKGGSEDLDGSGTVDFGDLLIVLDAWGACE